MLWYLSLLNSLFFNSLYKFLLIVLYKSVEAFPAKYDDIKRFVSSFLYLFKLEYT